MSFVSAQKARLLIGQTAYSGYTRSVESSARINMLDTTTIADTAKAFIVGQDNHDFSVGLLLDTDTTTGGEWSQATAWKAASAVPLSFFPSGTAALSEAHLIGALQGEFSTSTRHDGTVDAGLKGIADGVFDFGYSLEDLAAVTATQNGTSRDLTAQSTNGAVAHLHVTAFSGLTSDDITIEDSSTGSSGWATVGTFTQVTGITSQRLVIAGTIKRYVRVVDTIVGTGSITRQVSFARR